MVADMTPRALLALCLLPACHTAAAQAALPDPTRPPPGLQAAAAASAPVAEALVLQSVLQGPGRTPAAVISGQLVPLGSRLAGASSEWRLTRISDSAVQLTGPQGSTTLKLMPEGQKTARQSRTEPSR